MRLFEADPIRRRLAGIHSARRCIQIVAAECETRCGALVVRSPRRRLRGEQRCARAAAASAAPSRSVRSDIRVRVSPPFYSLHANVTGLESQRGQRRGPESCQCAAHAVRIRVREAAARWRALMVVAAAATHNTSSGLAKPIRIQNPGDQMLYHME